MARRTQRALGDWYLSKKKDYGAQDEKIAAMRRWCDVQKITHTPTIFINEHELPGEYSVEELKEVLA